MSWLARLKNSNVPTTGTAKTDKSPDRPLLSVLSVTPPAANEKREVSRTVVRYRLHGGNPNSWCSAIGTRPRAEVIADLQAIHGDALAEVLP